MTGKTTLADDPRFQYDLAMAESTLQSGELWIRDAFHRAEQHAMAGGGIDPAIDNDVRQSTTFLTQRACVVQDLYLHIGTTALRRAVPALLPRPACGSQRDGEPGAPRVRRPAPRRPEASSAPTLSSSLAITRCIISRATIGPAFWF